MTKEEVADIMIYCKENKITYKDRLNELGIPEWRFYEHKARYAKQQADGIIQEGEFVQLKSSGTIVSMPSFAATNSGSHNSKAKKDQTSKILNVEIRTLNGTMMRIQGELSIAYLQAIIQTSNGRV